MAERNTELDEWIARVTADALQPQALEYYTNRVNSEIMRRLPELADDAEFRRDLDASTVAQLRIFMTTATTATTDYRPPPEAIALARTVARRGLDVQVLLKVYGTGRTTALTLLNEIIETIPVSPEVKLAAIVDLWGLAMRWLEQSTDILLTTYTEEREALMRGALARRAETVHSMLRGNKYSTDTASTLLDYPMRRLHTGAVLWTADDEPDALARLESAARLLARALGAGTHLTIASGAHGLWAWFATVTPPKSAALGQVSGWPAGVRAATGTALAGMTGFLTTHREALAASRVTPNAGMTSAGMTGRNLVTHYDAVQIAYLMGVDRDALKRFVQRELGALTRADDATERLRETLRAYYSSGNSPARAAQQLRVHKNTVRYRIEQAQELLGDSFSTRRLEVELALICFDAYGTTLGIPGQD